MRKTQYFGFSTPLFACAVAALMSSVAAPSAIAEPHWFDPSIDKIGTLRICFKVTEMKQLGENDIEFMVEYSGDDTGTDKLKRQHYPSLKDVEYQKRGAQLSDNDPIVYAYRKGIYACEISWEYGAHWVVANEDVTGE